MKGYPLRSFFVAMALLAVTADSSEARSAIAQRQEQLRDIESTWQDKSDSAGAPLETLQDYLSAGLKRNPSLKGMFYEWKSSLQGVAQEFSLPDPQFSYTDYIEAVETRVGPQQRAYSLKQTIPFPDKLWIRKARAFKGSEAAYYRFEKTRLELINNIADAYYEFAYLSRAVLITQDNMKLLQNLERVAQSRYSSGLTKNQDLLKMQVELGKLENELKSLEDLKDPLTRRLTALLHLPENTELSWPGESLEDVSADPRYDTMEELIRNLKEHNPGLLAMSEEIESDRETVRLARREYAPDLTLGVTQIDTGESANPATADSGKDPLMVTATVNIPLWFNRINAGIRKAKSSLEAAEHRREGREEDLLSRLAMAHYKLRDARRQSKLYKDALIPKAVQALDASRSAYEAGGTDFFSFIDAQRMLLNFQMAYYRHNADFYQRLYDIQSLVGVMRGPDGSEGEKP